MQNINGRAVVSLLMALSMLTLLVSGFVLFASPQGRLAREMGWTFLGMDKGIWFNLHIAFGVIVLPIALFHVANNGRALVSYCRRAGAFSALKGRKPSMKPEPLIALAIFAFVFWASYMNYPPVSTLRDLQESFKSHWQAKGESR